MQCGRNNIMNVNAIIVLGLATIGSFLGGLGLSFVGGLRVVLGRWLGGLSMVGLFVLVSFP